VSARVEIAILGRRAGLSTADAELVAGQIYARALREAADIVVGAFHGEPFLNYPPDFADHLREQAAATEAGDPR
jgi:hypothetical protein